MDNDIDESIQFLSKFNNRYIHSLDYQLSECMNKVMEYKSQNPLLYSHKIKQYHRPVDVQPGTVGVALFGCEQNFYGSVDDRCTCLCLQETCRKQVWIVMKKKLEKLNNSEDEYAYLYVPDEYKLTKNHEKILRKAGVTEVCLLDTNYSKHAVIESIQLPEVEEPKQIEMTDESNETHETVLRKSSNNSWYLWLIGLIVFVFIFIVWWFMSSNRSNKIVLQEPNIYLGGLDFMTS